MHTDPVQPVLPQVLGDCMHPRQALTLDFSTNARRLQPVLAQRVHLAEGGRRWPRNGSY